MLNPGLKYCGGCNPRYDRAALAVRLKEDCPGVLLQPARPGVIYDALLVLCGCSARYADLSGLECRGPTLVLTREEDYANALAFLQGQF